MAYMNIQERRVPFAIRYLSDLFTFRHLCWNLVGSDLRARFRRSHLGILWALIQPLGFSLIVAAVWGNVFGVADYWEFALYLFSGMVLWEYFSNLVIGSQDALINAEGYLRQTRVPFFVFQLRVPLTGFVTMFFGFIGLLIVMAVLQRFPPFGIHYAYVVPFFVLFLTFAIPLAMIMSVIGTRFRDAKHISQLAIQGLFFLSPVMLARDVLAKPELWWLHYVNPMVPMYDLFRGPLMYGEVWKQESLVIVGIWTASLWAVALILQANAGRRLVFAV
jgi:lipopolysaccharide transport system permease protein